MKRRDLIDGLLTGGISLVATAAGAALMLDRPEPTPGPVVEPAFLQYPEPVLLEGEHWTQWIKVHKSLKFRAAGPAPEGPWPTWFVHHDQEDDPPAEGPEWVLQAFCGETGHCFIQTSTPDTQTWWNLGLVHETKVTTTGCFDAAGAYQERAILAVELAVGGLEPGQLSTLWHRDSQEELRQRLMGDPAAPLSGNVFVRGVPGQSTRILSTQRPGVRAS